MDAGEQCITEKDVPHLARDEKLRLTASSSSANAAAAAAEPSTVCRQIYKTQKLLAFDERGNSVIYSYRSVVISFCEEEKTPSFTF